jgi:hypothetical protein
MWCYSHVRPVAGHTHTVLGEIDGRPSPSRGQQDDPLAKGKFVPTS